MSASTQHRSRVRSLTDDEARDLAAWRASALEAMPYMASILFALRPVADPGGGTFAVDRGLRLYVDFDAVKPRGDRWCYESLLHECGHVLGSHADRAVETGVTPEQRPMWNYAGDAEINDDLVEAGCATIAADGVLPSRLGQPDHLLAETYFRAMQAEAQSSGGQGDPGESGQGESGAGTPGGGDRGEPGEYQGCGSVSGGQPAPGELGSDDDNGGTAPAATPGDIRWAQVATAAAIRDAESKSRGSVPGGIVEMAEGILAPSKVPWRTLLASAVRAGVRSRPGLFDRTYTKVDRRRRDVKLGSGRARFPGSYTPAPNIAVVRDTSGSMSHDDLMVVASEVEAIARRVGVRGSDLRVLDTDAKVHAVRGYQKASSIVEVFGRGGTDMVEGIAAAAELRPRPSVIVVITDGATPWPDERVGIPVVACLVGRGAASQCAGVPEWIRSVVVEPEAR